MLFRSGGLTVVPRVGTWIEIQLTYGRITQALSSPAWGRGLKLNLPNGSFLGNIVVPRVGTWIEIIDNTEEKHLPQGRPPHGDVD